VILSGAHRAFAVREVEGPAAVDLVVNFQRR
jgi:hypothetical protein